MIRRRSRICIPVIPKTAIPRITEPAQQVALPEIEPSEVVVSPESTFLLVSASEDPKSIQEGLPSNSAPNVNNKTAPQIRRRPRFKPTVVLPGSKSSVVPVSCKENKSINEGVANKVIEPSVHVDSSNSNRIESISSSELVFPDGNLCHSGISYETHARPSSPEKLDISSICDEQSSNRRRNRTLSLTESRNDVERARKRRYSDSGVVNDYPKKISVSRTSILAIPTDLHGPFSRIVFTPKIPDKTVKVSVSVEKSKRKRRALLIGDPNKPLDRSTMKMKDLYYYRPMKNMMQKKGTEIVVKPVPVRAKESDDEPSEEEVDDGPRVRLTVDGKIIVDEGSTARKNPVPVILEDVVEDHEFTATYNSFRKINPRNTWTAEQTDMFYFALSHIGTDFTLMAKLIPNQTRTQLKKKFKREEKTHPWKVDKALTMMLLPNFRLTEELFTHAFDRNERVKQDEQKRVDEKKRKTEAKAREKSKKKKLTDVDVVSRKVGEQIYREKRVNVKGSEKKKTRKEQKMKSKQKSESMIVLDSNELPLKPAGKTDHETSSAPQAEMCIIYSDEFPMGRNIDCSVVLASNTQGDSQYPMEEIIYETVPMDGDFSQSAVDPDGNVVLLNETSDVDGAIVLDEQGHSIENFIQEFFLNQDEAGKKIDDASSNEASRVMFHKVQQSGVVGHGDSMIVLTPDSSGGFTADKAMVILPSGDSNLTSTLVSTSNQLACIAPPCHAIEGPHKGTLEVSGDPLQQLIVYEELVADPVSSAVCDSIVLPNAIIMPSVDIAMSSHSAAITQHALSQTYSFIPHSSSVIAGPVTQIASTDSPSMSIPAADTSNGLLSLRPPSTSLAKAACYISGSSDVITQLCSVSGSSPTVSSVSAERCPSDSQSPCSTYQEVASLSSAASHVMEPPAVTENGASQIASSPSTVVPSPDAVNTPLSAGCTNALVWSLTSGQVVSSSAHLEQMDPDDGSIDKSRRVSGGSSTGSQPSGTVPPSVIGKDDAAESPGTDGDLPKLAENGFSAVRRYCGDTSTKIDRSVVAVKFEGGSMPISLDQSSSADASKTMKDSANDVVSMEVVSMETGDDVQFSVIGASDLTCSLRDHSLKVANPPLCRSHSASNAEIGSSELPSTSPPIQRSVATSSMLSTQMPTSVSTATMLNSRQSLLVATVSELSVSTASSLLTTTSAIPAMSTSTSNADISSATFNPEIASAVSNPEFASSTSNPEIASSTFNPEIASAVSNPEFASSTSNPEIASSTFNPEITSAMSNPEIASSTSNPEIASSTSNPEIASAMSNPDISSAMSKTEIASATSKTEFASAIPKPDITSDSPNPNMAPTTCCAKQVTTCSSPTPLPTTTPLKRRARTRVVPNMASLMKRH